MIVYYLINIADTRYDLCMYIFCTLTHSLSHTNKLHVCERERESVCVCLCVCYDMI